MSPTRRPRFIAIHSVVVGTFASGGTPIGTSSIQQSSRPTSL